MLKKNQFRIITKNVQYQIYNQPIFMGDNNNHLPLKMAKYIQQKTIIKTMGQIQIKTEIYRHQVNINNQLLKEKINQY